MKDEYILAGVLVAVIAAFYYFSMKKPSLTVQLMDGSGNLYTKGTSDNPVTSADIQAVTDLLTTLINKKAMQPN